MTAGDQRRALAVITTLFVMWAVALNLNDILIPHLKKACGLGDLQSAMIQTCYFGAYFLAALPAGWMLRRVGYKNGILVGLLFCVLGALLFYPSSYSRSFNSFLFALFIMACGAAVLEVAANPFVVMLGAPETAEWRLNMVQTFNALGAAAAPLIGRLFILSGIEHTPEQLAAMDPAAREEYRSMEAGLVRGPYLVIAIAFAGIAALVHASQLPPPTEDGDHVEFFEGIRRTLARPYLRKGVFAQFVYVGAQVGVSSFLIRFVQSVDPSIAEKRAADMLFVHLLLFLAGRAAGTMIMSKYTPQHVLRTFALGALTCIFIAVYAGAYLAIVGVVLVGFFNSIMFPTIFSLTVRAAGDLTKMTSSLLIMSIVGGAIVPAIMGTISDSSGIRTAFLTLAVCYAYVAYFAGTASEASPGQLLASK
eukprot:m.255548 g.255548  ORF g.255548 m.255548 type:complete len:421 (+) comp19565_c0_seq1:9-1271(+)